jgi:hypothetical protein
MAYSRVKFTFYTLLMSIRIWYAINGSGFESRQWQDIFLSSEKSRQPLRFIQFHTQWVLVRFPGIKRPGLKLITYLLLASRLRMSGVIYLLPLYSFIALRRRLFLPPFLFAGLSSGHFHINLLPWPAAARLSRTLPISASSNHNQTPVTSSTHQH